MCCPAWTEQEATELRIKTARVMGRQSLVQYIDVKWKGTPADVEREYQRNKAIALKYNCWKGMTNSLPLYLGHA
jgi:hypothetical protein